jgi:hypothetical protein
MIDSRQSPLLAEDETRLGAAPPSAPAPGASPSDRIAKLRPQMRFVADTVCAEPKPPLRPDSETRIQGEAKGPSAVIRERARR